MTKLQVTKSNSLLEASYQLNARAQKLMLCFVAKLNPQEKAKPEMSITASEFSELMKIPMSDAHRDLHAAADALFDAHILIKEDGVQRRIRWLQEDAIKLTGEGTVTVMWSNRILRHLCELERNFKSYNLEDIANLNTSHAIRLYEILVVWLRPEKRSGWRKLSLDEFKMSMGIADKYPVWKDLNKWVITPSLKQINKSSNLTVTMQTEKKGRKIVGLIFDFKADEQMQLPLEGQSRRPKKTPSEARIEVDENTRILREKYRAER